MPDIIEGVPTPDEYAEQGYRLKPPDPAARYERQHEVWRAQIPTMARGMVAVDPATTTASRLLVGGQWLSGPWYPAAVSPGGTAHAWVNAQGIAVRDDQVQARQVGPSGKLNAWHRHMDAEPEPDCPGSGYVATDHDGVLEPADKVETWCPECERAVPIVVEPDREEPRVQARHDKRGRPII